MDSSCQPFGIEVMSRFVVRDGAAEQDVDCMMRVSRSPLLRGSSAPAGVSLRVASNESDNVLSLSSRSETDGCAQSAAVGMT
ncbi:MULTISPECIES: hypothetical protein [Burkholderia]|uniref:hypothetical protein n=1 Tax=Burkholderia TaxID=32008 RepID=UPI00084130A1|nr:MULTISPECIES: hypothetical protein [unclassified Burkholderia]AOK29670.1 hypothetical protein AQ611_09755 [Burkholderia sp. Bp7605]